MCIICDGTTEEELVHLYAERIERHGWTACGVEPDEESPGWTYTIGLTFDDHPELLVSGPPDGFAMAVLGCIADAVVAGQSISAGDEVVAEGRWWRARPVHVTHIRHGLVGMATGFLGRPVDVLQLVPVEGFDQHPRLDRPRGAVAVRVDRAERRRRAREAQRSRPMGRPRG